MTRLTDLLLRRGVARFAKPLPVISPDISDLFFKNLITKIAGGTRLPAIPPEFAKFAGIREPLVQATVLALRQLAQGLPVDKALVRERLGEYAEDFLWAFDEVVRPTHAARSLPELQRSATEILTRLEALPKDRLERVEKFDQIVKEFFELKFGETGEMLLVDLEAKLLSLAGRVAKQDPVGLLTRREEALMGAIKALLFDVRAEMKDPWEGYPVPREPAEAYDEMPWPWFYRGESPRG